MYLLFFLIGSPVVVNFVKCQLVLLMSSIESLALVRCVVANNDFRIACFEAETFVSCCFVNLMK